MIEFKETKLMDGIWITEYEIRQNLCVYEQLYAQMMGWC